MAPPHHHHRCRTLFPSTSPSSAPLQALGTVHGPTAAGILAHVCRCACGLTQALSLPSSDLPGGSPSTRGDADTAQRRPAPVAGAPRSLFRGAPPPGRGQPQPSLSSSLIIKSTHLLLTCQLAVTALARRQVAWGTAPAWSPMHCRVCGVPGAGTNRAGAWQKEARTPGVCLREAALPTERVSFPR